VWSRIAAAAAGARAAAAVTISLSSMRSRAKCDPGSTDSLMLMAPDSDLKFHLEVSLNRRKAGLSAIIAFLGIQTVFITTSTSFPPVTDVRSARISCTSQRYASLGIGDGELDDCDEAVVLDILSQG
jgi:hypothetical protein